MKLTSSQDRAAVGRWIEGQADWAEGRRILAALPRLGRGEGWVWAPSSGVLAPVAFPLIGTFDSSGAPRREERIQPDISKLPVDLPGLAAALAEAQDSEPFADTAQQIWDLQRRLRLRERALAAAQARITELETATHGRTLLKSRPVDVA